MKHYERRAAGKEVYYKLAYYDAMNLCWHDTPPQYESVKDAVNAAVEPGKYRISEVLAGVTRTDLEPFEVK